MVVHCMASGRQQLGSLQYCQESRWYVSNFDPPHFLPTSQQQCMRCRDSLQVYQDPNKWSWRRSGPSSRTHLWHFPETEAALQEGRGDINVPQYITRWFITINTNSQLHVSDYLAFHLQQRPRAWAVLPFCPYTQGNLAGEWLVPCKKHYVIFITPFVFSRFALSPLDTQKVHYAHKSSTAWVYNHHKAIFTLL